MNKNVIDESQIQSLYHYLCRHNEGCSLSDLCNHFQLSMNYILDCISNLEFRGLVTKIDQDVKAINWWDKPHVELLLNIPYVTQEVFQEYCSDLDELAADLRQLNPSILRPYNHETGLEIIIGAAVGFVIVEFFKGFWSELGKKVAAFVDNTVKKRHRSGVDKIEICGTHNSDKWSISFSVTGSDSESVMSRFQYMQNEFMESERRGVIMNLDVGNEVILEGDSWCGKVKRCQ